MPANQQHGFLWEEEIKTKVFQVNAPAGYTDTHDIAKELNRFDSNETISIKVTGSGTVCMGDALRLFRYSPDETHTGIVVKYTQDGETKTLSGVVELNLSDREALWGSVTEEDVMGLDALVRSMPAGPRDPDIDLQIAAKKHALNAKSGAIRFNPKLDSKTQRRLQCSITNFATAPRLIRSSTSEALVRGVAIAASLVSGRRVRH